MTAYEGLKKIVEASIKCNQEQNIEIQQLKARIADFQKAPVPPSCTGRIIDQLAIDHAAFSQEKEITALKAEVKRLSQYNVGANKQHNELQDRNDKQYKRIAELKSAINIVTKCNQEQYKEIAALKVELKEEAELRKRNSDYNFKFRRNKEKEINELKAELQRRLSGADFEARQKLTEVIKETLKEVYGGIEFKVSRKLNDALNEYGTK